MTIALALARRLAARARTPRRRPSGQARWTSASSVAGASAAVTASSASRRAGRPAPHARLRSAACSTRPVGDRHALDARLVGAGMWPSSVAVIDALPAGAQHLDQPAAPRGVELAHHVVEQQQRRRAALGREFLALGQQQREQAEPVLAARAVRAQLAALAAQREVVAVRAVTGEAAVECSDANRQTRTVGLSVMSSEVEISLD